MLFSLATGVTAGVGIAAAAGLAVGGYFYASLWPASQIFGKSLIAPTRPDEIALTFDDGPNPVWTPRLLEILASHHVNATFFLVGKYAEAQPELVQQIVAAGHLVGVHSWSHLNLSRCSSSQIREELQKSITSIEDMLGQRILYFRPPFGARRPAVLRIARELGLIPVMWNAMTTDWKERDNTNIVSRLLMQISRNSERQRATNLVLHDGSHLDSSADREPSIAAVGKLIERLKSEKKFVRIDEWPASS